MTARTADVLTYVAAILIGAVFLFPVLWLVSLALRTQAEVYLGAARFIPKEPTFDNFRLILTDRAFGTYLWNSLKLSGIGAAIAVMCATPAAYVFSRRRFRGGMGDDGDDPVGADDFAARSSDAALPLHGPARSSRQPAGCDRGVCRPWPAVVGLAPQGEFRCCPDEIEDSARIDGCSPLRVLWEVSLPLAAPGLASAFILSMIAGWSQFLVPFILLSRDSQLPIAVAIFNFAGSTSASTTQLLAAACLIAVGPALIVFVALQRVIVRSILAGAVKG